MYQQSFNAHMQHLSMANDATSEGHPSPDQPLSSTVAITSAKADPIPSGASVSIPPPPAAISSPKRGQAQFRVRFIEVIYPHPSFC